MTPTGVAIRDVREQLFDAAERVLLRDGPNALTSRAVTTEAGCAKGVLHRHFADFDAFLVELVDEHVARVQAQGAALCQAAGSGTVTGNLAGALADLFGAIGLRIVTLVISRDELRARLQQTRPTGIPVLTDAGTTVSAYLAAEQELGRVEFFVDVETLALTLIGAGHLMYAGQTEPPARDEVEKLVASIVGTAM